MPAELLALLRELLPLWAVLLLGGFGYLLVLFKRTSTRFLELADKQTNYLKDRVEVVDKSIGIFSRTIDQQEKEITTLREQLQRVGADIKSTRENSARLSIQELELFSRWVETVSDNYAGLTPPVSSKQFRIAESHQTSRVPPEAGDVQAEISRAIRARDLSIYPILVSDIQGADALLADLRNAGYAASIYHNEASHEEPAQHQSIWVGAMVPPEHVSAIIAFARQHWPFLRYVHLSTDSDGPDDTHYTMFIGGSTESAETFLACSPWSADDFSMLSGRVSFDELHAYIRARYKKGHRHPPIAGKGR